MQPERRYFSLARFNTCCPDYAPPLARLPAGTMRQQMTVEKHMVVGLRLIVAVDLALKSVGS
jgi:hypothetical protein